MALGHVLSRAGAKMGINPSDPVGREVLLAYAQEAAEELFDQADMPGSLMEQNFKVNGDQTITFPSCVGSLRAIRETASQMAWHLNQLRPRYNQFPWTDMWRNWRLKNEQCLQNSVINESVATITVPSVENPPITIYILGQTDVANSIEETIVMDVISKQTTGNFIDYASVRKDRVNKYDVTVSDVDSRLLTTIPNNQLEAMYQVIDVSSCPWLPQNTSQVDNYVEVLYKRRLPWFKNDSDEFPAFRMDHIWVNKILQLWNEEQEKADVASAYDSKATRSLARKVEDQNRATEDMVAMVANPHDTILRRIGTGLRRRYRMFGGRRW